MSVIKSIERAYSLLEERNWDTVYWCIDLHGTCIKSNYDNCNYEFINEDVKKTLQLISKLKESVIVLWSSCYNDIKPDIFPFFNENNIRVCYFNENPDVYKEHLSCYLNESHQICLLQLPYCFDKNLLPYLVLQFFYLLRLKVFA